MFLMAFRKSERKPSLKPTKVVEAHKRDKSIEPEFRLDGSVVYGQRIQSWKGLEAVCRNMKLGAAVFRS